MDGIFTIGAIIALLLAAGGAIAALTGRGGVSFRWLFVAAGLVLLNDALLTRFYRLVPDLIHGHWNWQGKLTALLVTLAVAALPAFGWRASGLTLRQADLKAPLIVAGLYGLLFVGLALALPNAPVTAETLAFQLTMPGLSWASTGAGARPCRAPCSAWPTPSGSRAARFPSSRSPSP